MPVVHNVGTVPDEVYGCGRCGEEYFDLDEAIMCCAPGVTEGYRCNNCREWYESRSDAQHCCEHFLCTICDTEYWVTEYSNAEDAREAAVSCSDSHSEVEEEEEVVAVPPSPDRVAELLDELVG